MEANAEIDPTPPSQASGSASLSDPEPIAPADFKAKLLSGLGNRNGIIHTLLDDVSQDDRIFIYLHHDSDTFFTIDSSCMLFDFHELDGYEGYPSDYDNDLERHNNHRVYWRLHDEKGNTFAAPKSELWISPTVGDGDVFVPLGWLVERHQGSDFHRSTLYVCCINLSTDPVSVWLIYDYRFPYGMWKSIVRETGEKKVQTLKQATKTPDAIMAAKTHHVLRPAMKQTGV